MTTHAQPHDGATVVHIGDRLAKRGAVATATDHVELGRERRGTVAKLRDATIRSDGPGVLRTTWTGLATLVRNGVGYIMVDDYGQLIREAKGDADRAPRGSEERKAALELIATLRKQRDEESKARAREPRTIAAGVSAAAYPAAVAITVTIGSAVIGGLLAVPAPIALYLVGRRELKQRGMEAATAPEAIEAAQTAAAIEAATPAVPGVYTPEQLPDGKPFPIARAIVEDQAAECILRALLAEGVPVGDVSEVERTAWGWQCIVRVTSGTHEKTINAAKDLETTFDIAQGSVRVQPLVERRARAKFRIVLSDPFASAPPPEYRAPKSLSITDRARIGSSVDGEELLVTLAGVMGEIIAASGGGKTGIIQALGEVTTACRDAITIDLDPAGDGLEDLGPAARLQGRSHEQIEHVLLFLLMLAKARARLRKKLGMGRKWIASPEHPAIVTFIDEYPKLSKLGKRLAFELLLVGRKEQMPVEIASQGGTRAYLGENIAQMLALRLVGPCKVDDTRAVFGDGSAAEGYLPHRLSPATDRDSRDAGHIYAQGVPGAVDAPIEYKIHEHPKGMLAKLAEERRDAGLLDPDADSLQGMAGVDLPDYVLPEYDVEGNLKKEAPVELLTWEQLLKLCEADPPATIVTPDTPARETARKAVAVLDERGVDRARTEPLAEALGLGPETLRGLLREVGVEPVQLGAWDGKTNPRGYKREDLERLL